MYPGTGGLASIIICSPEHIVSAVASENIEAEETSPKKSTKIVISSVKVHPFATISTLILSPLSNSPAPLPAVAVTVLDGPAAPKGTPFLKNL